MWDTAQVYLDGGQLNELQSTHPAARRELLGPPTQQWGAE